MSVDVLTRGLKILILIREKIKEIVHIEILFRNSENLKLKK